MVYYVENSVTGVSVVMLMCIYHLGFGRVVAFVNGTCTIRKEVGWMGE